MSFSATSYEGSPTDLEWLDLSVEAEVFGLELPRYFSDLGLTRTLLQLLYSAREGRAIGFRWTKLIHLGHYILDKRPQFLRPFRRALIAYNRYDPVFSEDRSTDPLIDLLFPEIAAVRNEAKPTALPD